MKNLLTILAAFFVVSNLFAQIQYSNYGDGWVIPMNANLAFDVDNDGYVDFYLNQKEGDLGITTVPIYGCLVGAGYNEYTSFGTPEVKIFEPGVNIQLFGGPDYYIEDGDGSLYSSNGGGVFADGWADLEEHYLGFALFSNPADGWMKVAVDSEAGTLIIKEIAYTADSNGGGINIGETGISTSVSLLEEGLSKVSISPNPAKDFVNLNFDYNGDKLLSISILNSIGQKVQDLPISRLNSSIEINTANLAQGMYLIRFETEDGAHIEKLSIAK